MKYCEFCGSKLEADAPCTCPEAQHKLERKQKLIKKMPLFACVGVGLLVVILCVIILFQPGKINPESYVSLEITGYDGSATVEAFCDNELIYQAIGDEPENFEDYLEWDEKFSLIEDGITCVCEPSEQLKNGDTVLVYIQVSGEAAKYIKPKKFEFEVRDLEVLEKVDFFKDINLVFEGVSGEATASIVKNNDSPAMQWCDFDIDPMRNLSNGDVVTVSITNTESLAGEYNVEPVEKSKEFKVSGLGTFVSTPDDLPAELIKDLAKKYLEDTQKDLQEESSYFTYTDVELYGSYLCIVKEDSWERHNNELRIYVHYDEYKDGDFFRSIYMPIVFKDIIIDSEGNVDINYEDGITSYFSSDFQEHIEDSKEDFEIIKIS